MIQEVLALCADLGAGAEKEKILLPLAQATVRQLSGRLREGVTPEDCGPAFPLAAALLAMDRLSAFTGGGSAGAVTSFTAGDLTIRQEGGSAGSTSAQQAERLLAPWLSDGNFCFQGVEG